MITLRFNYCCSLLRSDTKILAGLYNILTEVINPPKHISGPRETTSSAAEGYLNAPPKKKKKEDVGWVNRNGPWLFIGSSLPEFGIHYRAWRGW